MRAAVTLVAAMATLAACAPAADRRPDAPPADHIATEAQTTADRDAFGIDNVMRTRPGGTIWTSHWSGVRRFDGVDPEDRWFDGDHGSATYKVRHGRLLITGNIPRMYVYDPTKTRQWRDVEVTIYFKRVRDTGIPYAGMTIVARSNHLDTESGRFECDTRGYGARLRYDGHTDFEKETAYPINEATANKELWPRGLPRHRWIGMKLIVFDAGDGVHLETWLDLADGRDGGHWHKINAVVDDGDLFGYEPCRTGIDPRMPLTNDPRRKGSETGKPNLTVYFRSDGVGKDGLAYKWASIREIEPERLP